MRTLWSTRGRRGWAMLLAPALAVAGLTVTAIAPAAAHSHQPASAGWVTPNKINALDCNGWAKGSISEFPHKYSCADPIALSSWGGYGWARTRGAQRFADNGHYVGHDEPSVKFISHAKNSGNTMTFFQKLPVDPSALATNTGSVVDYAQLSPAPWFGLPLCDNFSTPQRPCKPDSDSNFGGSGNPRAAGSAFMELQFYPPGFAPWQDSVSCSATKWCAAMNIDSLTATFTKAPNPSCPEPVNFAFLQRNGVPSGPPSPQRANNNTFTPNSQTLEMNPGDVLKVSITDPKAGFSAKVTDVTTGQVGFITASAKNGFMHTSYKSCAGQPYTFHAEYNTAAARNQVPWAALEGGVLMQQETGHSEVCTSLTHPDGVTIPYPGGQVFRDKSVFDTCGGGSEPGGTGEGSCSLATGVCQNPMTQGPAGPVACPHNSLASGSLCEFADGNCIPQGSRTVTINKASVKENSPVNFCQAGRFQNGDLDFDGIPYQQNTWPNGSPNTPSSIRYVGPFDQLGKPYPQIQFQSDAPGSEIRCHLMTGNGCVVPPAGAAFYPFWTMTNVQSLSRQIFGKGVCTWNFGNTIKGITTRFFGRSAQYGKADTARFAGTTISSIVTNPEFNSKGGCPFVTIRP